MVKKKIVSAVLALTLTLGAAGLPAADVAWFGGDSTAISASAATYGDYKYKTLSDGTVEISEYIGNDTTVKIPSEINGKTVTSIGDEAFAGTMKENCLKITSITIPNGVKTIGYDAFQSCINLKKVTIPNSVTTINASAFRYDGNLENITIPDSVKEIGGEAFHGTGIKSITIPNGVKSIEMGLLAECPNLTSVTLPDSITEIGVWAFTGCPKLKEITIPNKVTNIGMEAFVDCPNLKSVTIPKSVTTIDEKAFGYVINENTNDYEKISGFKIYCYAGTAGEKYAKDNGFDYALVTSTDVLSVDRVTTNGFTSKTNSVTVKWNKVSGASGYRIYKYNASTKKWSTLTTIKNGNTLSYTQSGLKSGTVYKYKVKAYTKKNGSTTWGESSETLTTATTPAKTVISSAKAAKTSVRLNWNKVNGADGYKVQQYKSGKWVTVATTNSTTATYKVTGLKKGTAYKFRIRAFKKVGGQTIFGAYSAVKTVKTTK